MADARPDHDLVASLLATLAAPGTEQTIAPDATISPQALANGATVAQSAQAQPRAESPHTTTIALPHLTIGHPETLTTTKTRPDLIVAGVLGEGGMGRVELARQHSLGRDVAIKTVRRDRVSVATVDALLQEARHTGSLEHPNIIPVHALGRDDAGLPLLVMKRIDGVMWRDLLRRTKSSTLQESNSKILAEHLEILMQVCNAVHFAHARGLVHRDLKPENVMVGEFGEVYVLDWGLAVDLGQPADMRSRELAGTPAYMAPEMLAGATKVTPATDVFLLGAILHELLTGKPRHTGATLREALESVARVTPYSYDVTVPEELAALANRATRADPAQRVPDARTFREALAAFMAHRGSVELTEETSQRLDELRQRLAMPLEPGKNGEIYRLGTECRFGFRQALRIWPENRRAQAALEATLRLLIEFELGRQNPGAVEILMPELREPPPELHDRLEALKARRRAEERAALELSRLAHEQDITVSARQRVLSLGLLVASGLGVATYLALRQNHTTKPIEPKELVAVGAVVLGAMAFSLLLGWRSLTKTRLNRQFSHTLLLTGAAILGHRVLGMQMGMAVPHILAGDLVVLSTVLVGTSLVLLPNMAWLVPVPLAAAVATAQWPTEAVRIFETTGLTTMTGLLLLMLIGGRKAAARKAGPSD